MELSEDQFLDLFLTFIEANHWSFGGGVRTIIDGRYLNEDGTPGEPGLAGRGRVSRAL